MSTDTLALTSTPTTATVQRRWRGILPWISHLFVGEKNEAQIAAAAAQRAAKAAEEEVRALASHGAGFMIFARFISRPLMIIFSFGALIVLAGQSIKHVYLAITGNGILDIVEVSSLIVMLALIAAADISMIVAAVIVQDAWQRHKWTGKDVFAGIVLGGTALLEAITLFIMIASVEHPHTGWEWFLVGLRSIMAPVVAIFLALLHARTPSDDDFRQVLAMRSYGLLLAKIKSDAIADDDIGLLYNIAATATGTSAQAQSNMEQLISAFNAATPGNIRRQADAIATQKELQWRADIEKMQAAYQQQLQGYSDEKRRLMDRLSSLETAENDARIAAQTARDEAAIQANSELGNTLQKVLLSLAYQQRLPDAIVEQYPDIAALNVESMFQQSAKHSRGNVPTKVVKESPDNAEGQRAFLRRILADAGPIDKMVGKPNGRNGVWITATVLPVLSGGKIQQAAAQDMVKSLNKGDKTAKIGTSNAAPFTDAMRYLAGLHLLSDEARIFWSSADATMPDDAA